MRYLGNASSDSVREAMRQGRIGQMVTPAEGREPLAIYDQNGEVVDWVWFAADNGCFGGKFPGDVKWFDWLSRMVEKRQHRCLFAVAPDEFNPDLGNDMGRLSLARSRRYFADIRSLGVPVALVCQNGLTPEMVPWGEIDWLFLGGCKECVPCAWVRGWADAERDDCPLCGRVLTEWKTGRAAQRLCSVARPDYRPDANKKIHMGRVNSGRRWKQAEVFGCDTVDGTFLAFGPDTNLPRLEAWPVPNLFGGAA